MSQPDVLDPWPDSQTVSVVDIARASGVTRGDLRTAEQEGLITYAGRGPNGRYVLSKEDAIFFLQAALIAATTGIAVVTVIKVLSKSGASITPGVGIVIPLPTG
ncbi:MAG: hypothetical protein ACREN8_00790 [Candidatus Dormibacteraceae bacterium]